MNGPILCLQAVKRGSIECADQDLLIIDGYSAVMEYNIIGIGSLLDIHLQPIYGLWRLIRN